MTGENCRNCKYFSNGFVSTEKEFVGIFYCEYNERVYLDMHACMYYQKRSKE